MSTDEGFTHAEEVLADPTPGPESNPDPVPVPVTSKELKVRSFFEFINFYLFGFELS